MAAALALNLCVAGASRVGEGADGPRSERRAAVSAMDLVRMTGFLHNAHRATAGLILVAVAIRDMHELAGSDLWDGFLSGLSPCRGEGCDV